MSQSTGTTGTTGTTVASTTGTKRTAKTPRAPKAAAPVAVSADTSKLNGAQAKSLARLVDPFKTALNEGRVSAWVAYKLSLLSPERQTQMFAATLAKGVKPTTGLIDAVNRAVAKTGRSFENALAHDPKALRAETEGVRVRTEGVVARTRTKPPVAPAAPVAPKKAPRVKKAAPKAAPAAAPEVGAAAGAEGAPAVVAASAV